MLNENRLYSISLGVASLQDGLVGVATALSPAMAGHFKFLLHHFFVRLGLSMEQEFFATDVKTGRVVSGAQLRNGAMIPFSWSNPYAWPRKPLLAQNVVATSQPLAAQAGRRRAARGGHAAAAVLGAGG